jgi:hypothetical protein
MGLLSTSLGIGAKGVSVEDLVTSGSLANIDMLFLASCEMARRSGHVYERESISFANAALVSGCQFVVAPVLPVNDLVTAVLVAEFCRSLRELGSVDAYRVAIGKVRSLSRDQFIEGVNQLWETLKMSEFAQVMPWPLWVVEKILLQRRDEAAEHQVWRSSTFLISASGTQGA